MVVKFQRVRVEEAGWDKFTGMLCGVQFTDGISDDPIPEASMNTLGAIMRVIACDDNEQIGAGVSLQKALNSAKAEPVKPLAEAKEEDKVAPKEEATGHTLESLEIVADKRGIAGLREIATPLGVSGRGISELIREILAHQGKS